MNLQQWSHYFEANRRRFQEPDFLPAATLLPKEICAPLVKSLAIFQLGESGGGTRLMRYVRQVVQAEELAGYEEAVRYFIAEEQYHAHLLAGLVTHLGGVCLQKQWSNSIFRWLRNHFGVEFNIQILLTAELIAEVYFALLYRKIEDPMVRLICHKILGDEMRHIAFHTEFLRERFATMPAWKRSLWRTQFRVIHHATSCIVALDHRECLRAAGTTMGSFVSMSGKTTTRFLRRLESPQRLWLAERGVAPQVA